MADESERAEQMRSFDPDLEFDERLRESLESMRTPMWVYAPLRKTPILWCNAAALELWRADTLTEIQSRVFEGDTGAAMRWLVAHRDELLSKEGYGTPWTIYPKDDAVQLRLLMRAVRLADGAIGMLTEGHVLDAELADPEAVRLQRANIYVESPMSVFDERGACLAQNAAARHTYGASSPFADRAEDPSQARALFERALSLNEPCRAELRMKTVGGMHWHAVELRRSRDPVHGGDGVVCYETSVDDLRRVQAQLSDKNDALEQAMTELKATQTQLVLQRQMAALGELVAGIAHEINTPVGAVVSAADTCRRAVERLKRSGGDDALAERLLSVLDDNHRLIHEAGGRVAEIVSALRRFVRLDEAEEQRTQLNAEINATVELMKPRLPKGVSVELELEELPELLCRPRRLNQAFLNLMVNAAQALEQQARSAGSDDSGRIEIRTRVVDDAIEITITDNGCGVRADDLPRLFDPGFTTRGVGVGTGLGLSICFNIVEEHGGRLTAESAGEGQGARFTLRLPLGPRA